VQRQRRPREISRLRPVVERLRSRVREVLSRLRAGSQAAARAVGERWGYLSLVLLLIAGTVVVDQTRENRLLRERLRWEPAPQAGEPERLPGALTERVPVAPTAPDGEEPEAEPESSPPAAVAVAAPVVRPEDADWPATGQLVRGFGWHWSPTHEDWRHHPGMDLLTAEGAEVRAALPGTVKEVRRDALWANIVVLEHGEGLRTVYAHLERVTVRPGERVTAGQVLGRVGQPGQAELADGFHLHFELHVDGRPVDPAAYLR